MSAHLRKPGRPRDEDLAARRRQEILAAAADVFAESGYRQTDVQVVADRIGVGKGTVYRYFTTKEELFLAAVDDGMQRLSACVDQAVAEEQEPVAQIAQGVAAYLGFFDEHPGMVELLIIERAEFRGRKKPTYFAYQESSEQKWHQFLEAAMQSGHIRQMSPKQILRVMSDVLYGAIFTNHFSGRRAPFEQQAVEILNIVFHGILSEYERTRRLGQKDIKAKALMTRTESNIAASKPRRARLAAGVAIVVLAIAIGLWSFRSTDEAEGPGRAAVPVAVSEVATVDLKETVRGIGTLRAPAQVEVSSEVAGRVRAIHFEEGSFVEAGAVLVRLENEKLRSQLAARQAAVRSAQVRLANARRTYQRQETLAERGVVAEEELEQIRAERDSAAAELERLQAEQALIEEQLNDMVIRAPFSGAISERLADPGAFVTAGAPLARLYQMDPLELAFSVPERFLGRLRPGQEVAVSLAAYPDRTFIGQVSFVSPVIDETTRTLAAKAEIPNPRGHLSPGAFATAVVTVGERGNRPVVPEESLVGTRSGYMTFVVDDGIAQSREVQTGLRRDGLVEITAGLQPGERVARDGHMRLDDGSPVEIVGLAEGDAAATP